MRRSNLKKAHPGLLAGINKMSSCGKVRVHWHSSGMMLGGVLKPKLVLAIRCGGDPQGPGGSRDRGRTLCHPQHAVYGAQNQERAEVTETSACWKKGWRKPVMEPLVVPPRAE